LIPGFRSILAFIAAIDALRAVGMEHTSALRTGGNSQVLDLPLSPDLFHPFFFHPLAVLIGLSPLDTIFIAPLVDLSAFLLDCASFSGRAWSSFAGDQEVSANHHPVTACILTECTVLAITIA
jgi:hypothetical protein